MCAPDCICARARTRVCVCVCLCVDTCAKARKGWKESERGAGRKGARELRWRIYERPKQAANPRPFARSFSFPAFFFFISTLARVVYLVLSRRAALRCAVRTQKHNFIPALSSPRAPPQPPLLPRPPLFKFYIVSIVVVTSRRFDYAVLVSWACCFLPQTLYRDCVDIKIADSLFTYYLHNVYAVFFQLGSVNYAGYFINCVKRIKK